MRLPTLTLAVLLAVPAAAQSVGTYSGCKRLGSQRAACEACVAGGNFYQKGQGCGMVAGMHKSKPMKAEPPPKPPATMPASTYVTITPKPFEIGARDVDPDKDDFKDVFEATVTLTRPFLMKTTEVTHGEWLYVMRTAMPSWDKACGLSCPVTYVGWKDALLYLNALSKKEGLEPCYEFKGNTVRWPKGLDCTGYRLPTDAEWEFAARGGLEEPTYGELDAIAWYTDNSQNSVHPVGKKQKNPYGLFDMLGNVSEWMWDDGVERVGGGVDKPYKGEVTDPIVGGLEVNLDEVVERAFRGGDYTDARYTVRVTYRERTNPSGSDRRGFRPVRTVAPPKR
jgi:formylglycine-generating enzyme required for sulfatase activity